MTWIDNELLRASNRPEWPALLHNICMLHSAIRLRCRFDLAGWNKPEAFRNVGTGDLWVRRRVLARYVTRHDLCRLSAIAYT
jgi:hypothetical protein